MFQTDESRKDDERELRLRDLIEDLVRVNQLIRCTRDWREQERLRSEKCGLVSAAIILIGADRDTLRLQYQMNAERSHRYLLVTLIACGSPRSVHVPVDQLTSGARVVVEKALGRCEGFAEAEAEAEEPERSPAAAWRARRRPHFAMS